MGLFDWLKPKKTVAVSSTFQIVNGQLISPTDDKGAYITDGYTYNDIIYSIVNLILSKVREPEWNQYKIVDDESFKSYLGLMKRKDISPEDFRKAIDLKKKALEFTEGDARIAELLRWPNENETFGEFVANGTGYKLLTGDRYIWAEMIEAGANGGKPLHLYNLPSQHVQIEGTTGFPTKDLRYHLYLLQQQFEKETVLHEKYWNPEWDSSNQQLYGLSPLKAALKIYSRNNSAKVASKAAFDNQGVKGILSADVDPSMVNEGNVGMLLEQSNKTKQLLSSPEYAGAAAYNKIAVSGYRMNWVNIGLSPVDLDIIESEKWDLNRLCAIFGVPPQLLGNSEASTYNNVREAEKALTARVALPMLTSFRNQLNKKFQSDWGLKGKNIYIDFDQTVFSELDENTKDKVDWVSKLWMLAPNKQLELMNIEQVDNPLFDEPWIDNTKVPLSEFLANEVDRNLQEDGI